MKWKVIVLCALIVVLFALNLLTGSVDIPMRDVLSILFSSAEHNEIWRYIILETRLPQAITATLCGSALAVSGLLLQTAFRNPLAGPSIFGISSGASLGVALVMLAMGGSVTAGLFSVSGFVAILLAAFIGAMLVTAVIFIFSTLVRNSVMLLIIGVMVGYLSSSAITLLNFFATEEGVRSYMIWGMGNFGSVSMAHIPVFAVVTILGLLGAVLLIKPLNALLLGEQYAENLGVNIRRTRNLLLVVTGLRSYCLHRLGGSPYRPSVVGYREPPSAVAFHHSLWSCGRFVMQLHLLFTRRIRHHSVECGYPVGRCTRHHLCHHPAAIIMNYALIL